MEEIKLHYLRKGDVLYIDWKERGKLHNYISNIFDGSESEANLDDICVVREKEYTESRLPIVKIQEFGGEIKKIKKVITLANCSRGLYKLNNREKAVHLL